MLRFCSKIEGKSCRKGREETINFTLDSQGQARNCQQGALYGEIAQRPQRERRVGGGRSGQQTGAVGSVLHTGDKGVASCRRRWRVSFTQ